MKTTAYIYGRLDSLRQGRRQKRRASKLPRSASETFCFVFNIFYFVCSSLDDRERHVRSPLTKYQADPNSSSLPTPEDSKVVVKAIVLELYNVFILVLRVQDSNWYNLFNSTSRREGQVGPIFHISKMIFVCDGCIYRRISIIRTLLILSGIEINPGPIKLITVNCRGLSSRVKLLSTIGKLRKESERDESCIIFMQETHLDDAELITKIWDGTQVVSSYFNNSQRGTIIILKGNISVRKSISDQDGRFNLIHVSHDLFQEGDPCYIHNVPIQLFNSRKDSTKKG